MGARRKIPRRDETDPVVRRFRRAIAPAISGRSSDFLPDVLYHYTTAAGLCGITDEKKLRATNFSFMNDPSEVQYGRELIEDRLAEAISSATNAYSPFLSHLISNFNIEMLAEVYACCFTKLRDDLSQWRSYGSANAERYSIGFNASDFYELAAHDENTYFWRVEYDRTRQIEKIDDVLDRARQFIGQNRPNPHQLGTFGERAASQLAGLVPALKNPAYAREEEWGLVKWIDRNDPHHAKFDVSRGVLRPYITFALPSPLLIVSLHVLAPTRREPR